MRKFLLGLVLLTTLACGQAPAQTPNFPQTLPPNTLVGRLGIGAGPAQAIPLSMLNTVTDTVRLDVQYGVKCDGVVDNSAAITQAIVDATAKTTSTGLGQTLIFPKGVCLAPTLQATMGGVGIWLTCNGAPGTCILKGNASIMLTIAGSLGGIVGMGLDNGGPSTNITINVANGVCCTQFRDIVLGHGISTFFLDQITNTSNFTFDNITGIVSCTPAQPLFWIQAGGGFAIRNSNISTNCANFGTTVGRSAIAIGGGGNFDTLIVQDSVFFNFDAPVVAVASNGQSTTDVFLQGNIWDVMVNGMDFVAQAGGLIADLYLDDPWVGVYQNGAGTAGACMLFQGAGQIVGVHITARLPICGGSGIVGSVTTASFWTIDGVSLDGGNSVNVGGTSGLLLNQGGTTWSNITVKNSNFAQGISSTHPLATGCQTGGAITNFLFMGNNCIGTTNYNGMLTGTGSVFAHTNSKQFGNIGLADSVDQLTFATLPANPMTGTVQYISDALAANCGDGTCNTAFTTVTGGGGALKRNVMWNGANWTMVGK